MRLIYSHAAENAQQAAFLKRALAFSVKNSHPAQSIPQPEAQEGPKAFASGP